MARTLILGLGGTGSRAVEKIVRKLDKQGIGYNKPGEEICLAVLDTDANDREGMAKRGVTIPIIATGSERKIGEYISQYRNDGVESWMPKSYSLYNNRDISQGAGQMRFLSRLAFYDTVRRGKISELTSLIHDMITTRGRDGNKIFVMIVSSLAGGTGSGMFIQVALWVRQYLKEKCNVECNVKGVFMMPDIFIENADETKSDEEKKKIRANAYAAIRELNTITKICCGKYQPDSEIKLDNFFTSVDYLPGGKGKIGVPVYDSAFFVDTHSTNGTKLGSLSRYEELTANLVYTQMFSPIKNDVGSVEDNYFAEFATKTDPVYGACGMAKAVYPKDEVIEYLALKTAFDSLQNGLDSIDEKIRTAIKQDAQKRARGIILNSVINEKTEFIKEFTERTQSKANGSDTFFTSLFAEYNYVNKKTDPATGLDEVTYTDKVTDFMKNFEPFVRDFLDVKNPGGIKGLAFSKGEKTMWDNNTELTYIMVNPKREEKINIMKRFEATANEVYMEDVAESIVNAIFTTNMGATNPAPISFLGDETGKKKMPTIYSMMTVPSEDSKETMFANILTVRYIAYRLADEIAKKKKIVDGYKNDEENQYSVSAELIKIGEDCCDDPRTRNKKEEELTPNSAKTQIKFFKEQFPVFLEDSQQRAIEFLYSVVMSKVCEKMIGRLQQFATEVKALFAALPEIKRNLEADMVKCEEAIMPDSATLYLCASTEDKDYIYRLYNLAQVCRGNAMNGEIFKSVYGIFCAKEDRSYPANEVYVDGSISRVFNNAIKTYYVEKINEIPEIDMDIYQAVCCQVDQEIENATSRDYDNAMKRLTNDLIYMSSVYLRYNASGNNAAKEHRSWGFNPALKESYSAIDTIITGGNIEKQMSDRYSKSEIICYSSACGIFAEDIYKFNEFESNPEYFYPLYDKYMDGILKNAAGNPDAEEFIKTPFTDKTWHRKLPYISESKRDDNLEKFFRAFWMSIAYAFVELDSELKKDPKKSTSSYVTGEYMKVYGQEADERKYILHDGRHITMRKVSYLIDTLMEDPDFLAEARRLDKFFRKDLEKVASTRQYTNTEFFKGISGLSKPTASKVIIWYNTDPDKKLEYIKPLRESLDNILKEIVNKNYGTDIDMEIDDLPAGTDLTFFEAKVAARNEALGKLKAQIDDSIKSDVKEEYSEPVEDTATEVDSIDSEDPIE